MCSNLGWLYDEDRRLMPCTMYPVLRVASVSLSVFAFESVSFHPTPGARDRYFSKTIHKTRFSGNRVNQSPTPASSERLKRRNDAETARVKSPIDHAASSRRRVSDGASTNANAGTFFRMRMRSNNPPRSSIRDEKRDRGRSLKTEPRSYLWRARVRRGTTRLVP